jgi:dihydrofolate synthase/folylpolyglutamate synthase
LNVASAAKSDVAGSDMAYRTALDSLFKRTTGEWRLGLERVLAFLGRLGDPHLAYPVFHVAGTNGKGSTVATLDALLQGAGMRVGRYTSPHLVDFRERIVVNGVPIPGPEVVEFLKTWNGEAERAGATFFEVTTAMGLHYFATQRVDVALVEVGLGGLLDATNVVRPVAAAVTQIGFDHMDYLGSTLEEIAVQKAGIFKPGAIAVVGDCRADIQTLLASEAERRGASDILVCDRDWRVSDAAVDATGTTFTHDTGGHRERLRTGLTGVFQAENSATALAMLRGAGGLWADAAQHAAEFLPAVRLAGRFHRVARYIFDVAHNPDGAQTVAANLVALGVPAPVVAIVSVLRDKDWRGILSALSSVTSEIILTNAPTAPASRAWNIDEAFGWSQSMGIKTNLVRDFQQALDRANDWQGTVLITGSFHTVGDAMERLQVDPLAR